MNGVAEAGGAAVGAHDAPAHGEACRGCVRAWSSRPTVGIDDRDQHEHDDRSRIGTIAVVERAQAQEPAGGPRRTAAAGRRRASMSMQHAERPQEVAERLHVQRDRLAGEHLVLVDLDDRRGGSAVMGTVKHMDLDALTAARRDEWARLDELSRARRLAGGEVDELVDPVPRRIRRSRRRQDLRGAQRPRATTSPRCSLAHGCGSPVPPRTSCASFRGSSRCSCRPRCTACAGRRSPSRWASSRVVHDASRCGWRATRHLVREPRAAGGARAVRRERLHQTTTARTRPRCSRARCGRTTRGSPPSACCSASPGLWPHHGARPERRRRRHGRGHHRRVRPRRRASCSTSSLTACSSSRASSWPGAAGLQIFWAWVAPGRVRGRVARGRRPIARHDRDRPRHRPGLLGDHRGVRHAPSRGRGR